jgi:D-serine dehydratase
MLSCTTQKFIRDNESTMSTLNNTLGMNSIVQPLSKGIGFLEEGRPTTSIRELGWNLLAEDVSLPAAVLYEEKLAHNLAWMQKFAESYAVKLAPHGKTTMAPKLFGRQLQAGAWGITLATTTQVRVAYEHGVRRVLMANQLVGRQNMTVIARMQRDPDFEFYCLIDSAEQVETLGRFFQSQQQRLNVLLELGVAGGRTGVRDRDSLQQVVTSLSAWKKHIALCGIELYEGVLSDEPAITSFLQRAVNVLNELAQEDRFERTPVIISGAGSAWYDVVAEVFSKATFNADVEPLLRPGCYLTHDAGIYRDAQRQIMERNSSARAMPPGLLPALQLWAYVQSIPEKNLAIIALGKRDAAFDAGLPTPALHFRPGQERPSAAAGDWKLTRMMDQHAYMQIAEGSDVRVGDIIAFGISHPCLTFDKWKYLLVVDSKYQVVDVVETFF